MLHKLCKCSSKYYSVHELLFGVWSSYICRWCQSHTVDICSYIPPPLNQAKRKEIRAEQEKKLAQQKKEEEERLRKEEAEKKAKEAEEKRKRLEEAEKKRQAMMQAQKEKQSAGDKKGGAKKTDGGVRTICC